MAEKKENTIHPLAAILLAIGTIALVVLSYLGMNYLFGDNPILSGVIAIIGTVVIFSIVLILVKAKNRSENKGIRPYEVILLLIYLAIAVASYFPISHFVNVDLQHKEDIRRDALAKMDELTDLTTQYEAQAKEHAGNLNGEIDVLIATYKQGGSRQDFVEGLQAYGIDLTGVQERELLLQYAPKRQQTVINGYMEMAMNGYADVVSRNEAFLQEKRPFIQPPNWNRAMLYDVLSTTEEKLQKTHYQLKEMFASRNPDETAWNTREFTYELSAPMDAIINDRQALIDRYQPDLWLPLGLTIIIHLFILAPYLVLARLGIQRYYSRKETEGGAEV